MFSEWPWIFKTGNESLLDIVVVPPLGILDALYVLLMLGNSAGYVQFHVKFKFPAAGLEFARTSSTRNGNRVNTGIQ